MRIYYHRIFILILSIWGWNKEKLFVLGDNKILFMSPEIVTNVAQFPCEMTEMIFKGI